MSLGRRQDNSPEALAKRRVERDIQALVGEMYEAPYCASAEEVFEGTKLRGMEGVTLELVKGVIAAMQQPSADSYYNK